MKHSTAHYLYEATNCRAFLQNQEFPPDTGFKNSLEMEWLWLALIFRIRETYHSESRILKLFTVFISSCQKVQVTATNVHTKE